MINFNGKILSSTSKYLDHQNRALRYGDSLFETLRSDQSKIFFWEDHYLRLMASMRILRMEIPMDFTMEFLQSEIIKTIEAKELKGPSQVRLTVFRNDGGLYRPETNTISYIIETENLEAPFFILDESPYEVELFKDFYVNAGMLSTLKTNNKIINVLGSIYAEENEYDNCLLLNQEKQVIGALDGNLFMVLGSEIITPPLEDGGINGILRKKLVALLNGLENYSIQVRSISPFDLQKADELFVTNAIIGIRPITKYRKKSFEVTTSKDLIGKLNALARTENQ